MSLESVSSSRLFPLAPSRLSPHYWGVLFGYSFSVDLSIWPWSMLFRGKHCPSKEPPESPHGSLPPTHISTLQWACTHDFSQRLTHFPTSCRWQLFPKQFWLRACDAYWIECERKTERGERVETWRAESLSSGSQAGEAGPQYPPKRHPFSMEALDQRQQNGSYQARSEMLK